MSKMVITLNVGDSMVADAGMTKVEGFKDVTIVDDSTIATVRTAHLSHPEMRRTISIYV